MTAKELLRESLDKSAYLLHLLTEDMTDADFLVRPHPRANHFAWQLGHLLTSEAGLQKMMNVAPVELPAGFAEQHAKPMSQNESPKGFATKNEYLNLFSKVRGATMAALDGMSEFDFDKPSTGRMAEFAPTYGKVMLLIANHMALHTGQLCVIRRSLDKPVKF